MLLFSMVENEKDLSKFQRIYDQYKNMMYWVAYDITKNTHDAEDVVQLSLIKLIDIIETNYPAFTVPRGFKCRNNREINDTHTNLTTSIYCSKPSSITSPVESKRTELRALR